MNRVPRIFLIGAGAFGLNYLRILQNMHNQGLIEFVGVGVTQQEHASMLRQRYNVSVYTDYIESVKNIDGVCIVTPPSSHFEILEKCLPFTNVLCEKPLVLSVKELKKTSDLLEGSAHLLMVGHLFRFHPVTKKLREVISKLILSNDILSVSATFCNPAAFDKGRNISSEFIHWYDLIEHIWGVKTFKILSKDNNLGERCERTTIKFNGQLEITFILGWLESEKKRNIRIDFSGDVCVFADYLLNRVEVRHGRKVTSNVLEEQDVLADEISIFVSLIKGLVPNPVAIIDVKKSIEIAEQVNLYEQND